MVAGSPSLSLGGTHCRHGTLVPPHGVDWHRFCAAVCLPEVLRTTPWPHSSTFHQPTEAFASDVQLPGSPSLVLVPWHSSFLRWTASFLLDTYSAQTIRTVSEPLKLALCKFCHLSSQCTMGGTMCLGLFQVLQLSQAEMVRQTFPLVLFLCSLA